MGANYARIIGGKKIASGRAAQSTGAAARTVSGVLRWQNIPGAATSKKPPAAAGGRRKPVLNERDVRAGAVLWKTGLDF
ncbi:MAG: hypothetical protein JW822_06730 [Spirochaetales bacterium]|nr:hypothetical protein [Spirochaetales bacterium]